MSEIVSLVATLSFLALLLIHLIWHVATLPLFALLGLSLKMARIIAVVLVLVLFRVAFFPPGMLTPVFCYLSLFYLAADVIKVGLHLVAAGKPIEQWWQMIYAGGTLVWLVTLCVCLYGYLNAKHLRVTQYSIAVAKPLEQELRLVFISDIHLGMSITPKDLATMVERVNALEPDVVVLGGDIYDERTPAEDVAAAYPIWQQLAQRYPVYYVMGNHDYGHYGGGNYQLQELLAQLQQVGVQPLMDAVVLLPQQLYLVGRQDADVRRLPLAELLAPIDSQKPVVVVDHQPRAFSEAVEAAVDLQMSGHTHAGQIFPFNLLTQYFNGVNYGYRRQGNSQLLVSSGLGTWGFPLRTVRHSEIVLVNLTGTATKSE